MDYLLVYGIAAAASVTVGGKALPKLARADPDAASADWIADHKDNRLIIRLPALRGESSDPVVTVAVGLA